MKEKAKECASVEEFQAFCESFGVKLTEEELKGIAGGALAGNRQPWCMGNFQPCPRNLT